MFDILLQLFFFLPVWQIASEFDLGLYTSFCGYAIAKSNKLVSLVECHWRRQRYPIFLLVAKTRLPRQAEAASCFTERMLASDYVSNTKPCSGSGIRRKQLSHKEWRFRHNNWFRWRFRDNSWFVVSLEVSIGWCWELLFGLTEAKAN